jgi:HAAS
MEELERYLDRVCRGIRGPRSLRQHIRRELEEHLLDAVAQHRAAGLADDEALRRALEDFGGPDEVGSDLEEQYGHRLMAVVIEKAIHWKEMTMKAKWLWTTWAHVGLALVIAVELSLVTFAMLKIVPAYEHFRHRGMLDMESGNAAAIFRGADDVLSNLTAGSNMLVNYWFLWAIPAVALWAAFEWRNRSENKSLMRLSAMGMLALGSTLWVAVMASALIVAFVVATPQMYVRSPEPIVREQIANVDRSLDELEKTLASGDWKASREHMANLHGAVDTLSNMGGAAPVLIALDRETEMDAVRKSLWTAKQSLNDARNAILQENTARANESLAKFQETYRQVPGVGK